MTLMRYVFLNFFLLMALTFAPRAWATWLSPKSTAENPYTFLDKAGTAVQLPSMDLGWSILYAANADMNAGAEIAKDYFVSKEGDAEGAGMMRFGTQIKDEATYLALGISESDAIDLEPYELKPEPGKVRIDNIYAKVRFAPCSEIPAVEELMEMFTSEAVNNETTSGLASFTAAKLGICVYEGYFYLSRVKSDATGAPENYDYEFCRSKYSYAEVGGGATTIRIEFNTYESEELDGSLFYRRAYRVFARPADGADDTEVCLSEGLGYPWQVDIVNKSYQFDFQKIGKGEWLYAIDDALAVVYGSAGKSPSGEERGMEDTVDYLNNLAFSANAGGFYSAWMQRGYADDVITLAQYDTGAFTPFVSNPGAYFDLYSEWASTYGVSLSDYLDPKTGGVSLFAARQGDEELQRLFDAFLLYMDPETDEPLRLQVTGIVTGEENVSFTVIGPEGCDLKKAIGHAARLRIRRAATLDGFANATVEQFDASITDKGEIVLELPKLKDGVEQPFFQAVLVPVTECE